MNAARHLAAFAGVIACLGCTQSPTSPAAATTSSPSTPPTSVSSALSVAAFDVSAWHADGKFHYRPKLSVAAAATGGAVDVQGVSFEHSVDGIGRYLTGIQYPTPRNVPASGTHDLISSTFEIVTATALATLTARITFVDAAGQSGIAAADTVVPAVPQELPDATLEIRAFSVTGSSDKGTFSYWPRLTLAETTGRNQATIVRIVFELLDVGLHGRVPPYVEPIVVRAGGTVVLDEDGIGFGWPWLEISRLGEASRVSVVISYVDGAGRGRSVGAVVEVSR